MGIEDAQASSALRTLVSSAFEALKRAGREDGAPRFAWGVAYTWTTRARRASSILDDLTLIFGPPLPKRQQSVQQKRTDAQPKASAFYKPLVWLCCRSGPL